MADFSSEPQWHLITALLSLPGLISISLVFMAICLSSYVKFATVFGIVRIGLGFNSIPSVLVTGGLSIALSLFVMYPTLNACGAIADKFLSARTGSVSPADQTVLLQALANEWGKFLMKKTPRDDMLKLSEVASKIDGKKIEGVGEAESGSTIDGISENQVISGRAMRIVVPAFILSQLKSAFATGVSVFIPFLIIDLLVAAILATIGMVQLNPLAVALPIKLLLFVMVDGWELISTGLINTYGG